MPSSLPSAQTLSVAVPKVRDDHAVLTRFSVLRLMYSSSENVGPEVNKLVCR